MMNETASVRIRIPKETDTYFELLAKQTDTSKSFHIGKALNAYLERFGELPSRCDDTLETETEQVIGSSAVLDKTDVSVSTKNELIAQLRKVRRSREKKKRLSSPFLSSPPTDLGYTDASLPDKIIAGES